MENRAILGAVFYGRASFSSHDSPCWSFCRPYSVYLNLYSVVVSNLLGLKIKTIQSRTYRNSNSIQALCQQGAGYLDSPTQGVPTSIHNRLLQRASARQCRKKYSTMKPDKLWETTTTRTEKPPLTDSVRIGNGESPTWEAPRLRGKTPAI